MRKVIVPLLAILVVVAVVLVLVGNFAITRTNPPVTHTVQWDSPRTEALARAACFDCHSNETRWPWYAYVAPMAQLVVHDVQEGRENMNFSTGRELEGDEMIENIESGEMPLPIYVPLHPEANLSAEDKATLIEGLRATFGD